MINELGRAMKFSIDRDAFSDVLSKIQGVCSQKSTFVILGSCLIEAREGGITILGTDLDIAIKASCQANVEVQGEVVLSARRLYDTVRSLQFGPLTLTLEGNQVIIESGRFKARLMSSPVEDFISLPQMTISQDLTIKVATLHELINKTIFSISSDETRIDFTGALFVVHADGRVQMVSTDGHRLSRIEDQLTASGEVNESFKKGVIIPKKGLNELKKILTDGNVSIDIDREKLIVSSPSISLSIQLIPGHFPDFTKVIPKKLEHKAIVDRMDFIQLLKRASIYTTKVGTIRLTLANNQLGIHAFDSEAGEVHDDIECDYKGSGVTAGFNWKYIDQVLSVLESEKISLEIIDSDNPSLIRELDNNKMDFIVMPMQL